MSALSSHEPSTESDRHRAEEIFSSKMRLMELQTQIVAEGINFSSMRQLFDSMLQAADTFTPDRTVSHLGSMIAMLQQLIAGHKERVSTNCELAAAPAPGASSGMLQRSRQSFAARENPGMSTEPFPGVAGSADEADHPAVVQPPSRSAIRPEVRARVEAFVKFAVAHLRQKPGCSRPDSLVRQYNEANPELPPVLLRTLPQRQQTFCRCTID